MIVKTQRSGIQRVWLHSKCKWLLYYTRGVDRFTQLFLGDWASQILTLGNQFTGADALWKSFQSGIEKFVNQNGGSAVQNAPVTNRPDWSAVKDVIEGRKPLSSLGCK